jgi:predicted acyltransferase
MILAGLAVLLLAAWKRQHLNGDSIDELLFTYQVMGRAGIVLILLGALSLLLIAGGIIYRKAKAS